MESSDVKYIVVHCSATPPTMDIGAVEIDRWHRQRGFRKIGYHYVIRRDGTLNSGRDLDEVGAHVEGYNSISWGVCMVGGVNEDNYAVENFTPAQYRTLKTVIEKLLTLAPKAEVLGHRDFPGVRKACPSFDVKPWWAGVNNA